MSLSPESKTNISPTPGWEVVYRLASNANWTSVYLSALGGVVVEYTVMADRPLVQKVASWCIVLGGLVGALYCEFKLEDEARRRGIKL